MSLIINTCGNHTYGLYVRYHGDASITNSVTVMTQIWDRTLDISTRCLICVVHKARIINILIPWRTHTHNIYIFARTCTFICICIYIYTGCNRRNGPDFGRVFLMLNYTDITQNTYIQGWTVTEIMASEVWNFDSCHTLTDYQIRIQTGRNMWFL